MADDAPAAEAPKAEETTKAAPKAKAPKAPKAKPAKAPKAKAPPKPKGPAEHPTYVEMVKDAILSLKVRRLRFVGDGILLEEHVRGTRLIIQHCWKVKFANVGHVGATELWA